jgi:hypothetical protein
LKQVIIPKISPAINPPVMIGPAFTFCCPTALQVTAAPPSTSASRTPVFMTVPFSVITFDWSKTSNLSNDCFESAGFPDRMGGSLCLCG